MEFVLDSIHSCLQALLGLHGIKWLVQIQKVMKGPVVCTLV